MIQRTPTQHKCNMTSVVKYVFYILPIVAITVFAFREYRFRLVLLCYLSFMFFIHPNVFTPVFFGGHPRLPIALLLTIAGWPELKKTANQLHTSKILIPVFLWFFYTTFSATFISNIRNYNLVYQQMGDALILLLVATYIASSTYKELLVILSSIMLALVINLIAYTPKISPMFSFIPMHEYYHHGGAGLSGFKIMPLLLFIYNRDFGKVTKFFIFGLMIFASLMAFLSGSRTAMIGIFIVLVLFRRTIKWWLLLLVMGILAFYLGSNYADPTWGTERVTRLYEAFNRGDPNSLREVEFRMSHLRIGYEALQEQPLIGYGYGSWNLIRDRAYGIIGTELSAHGAYALLMSETGLVGIVLFFTMIYFCIRRTGFKTSKIYQYDLRYITTICIIAYLLLGINSSSFWNRDFSIYLGISAGSRLRIIISEKCGNE